MVNSVLNCEIHGMARINFVCPFMEVNRGTKIIGEVAGHGSPQAGKGHTCKLKRIVGDRTNPNHPCPFAWIADAR